MSRSDVWRKTSHSDHAAWDEIQNRKERGEFPNDKAYRTACRDFGDRVSRRAQPNCYLARLAYQAAGARKAVREIAESCLALNNFHEALYAFSWLADRPSAIRLIADAPWESSLKAEYLDDFLPPRGAEPGS